VQIDLIVRGVCSLRPGVPVASENIRVRSIIGRFLEHSRIYYFHNGGEEKVYVGSADLMPRNLNRRVEVLFPIENAAMLRRIRDKILEKYLTDQGSARIMQPDGTFIRQPHKAGRRPLNAQEWFMKHEA
jgi:polyphosphate kinase